MLPLTLDESQAIVESPQLHKLVVKPLQTIPSKFSKPIASILDALDECGAAESRETLLEALVEISLDPSASLLPAASIY